MLSAADSLMWDALEIGPQWILRDTEDVTLAETALRAELRQPAPAVRSAAPTAPSRPAPRPAARSTALPPGMPPEFAPRPAPARPAPVVRPVAEPISSAPQAPALVLPPEVVAACEKADWATLEGLAGACTCCSMAKSRQHVVFAEGGPGMRIALVGEAPGSEEDLQGIPFVGKSGQLLTQMLESIGIERRRDIAIMNVLKCRPPGNRNPRPEEVLACSPFLREQIRSIWPDIIVTLGNPATHFVLKTEIGITKLRGRFHQMGHFVVMPTFHPAAALRNPAWQELLEEDFKMLGDYLERHPAPEDASE